jgi:chromosome partitioning protein
MSTTVANTAQTNTRAAKARIIAVVNNKGGVGKTTATVHIGHALSRMGKTVLCVDMDDQANLVQFFFGRRRVNELKKQQHGIPLPIQHHHTNVDVLMLSSYIADERGYAKIIRSHATAYDIILIDSPPALEKRTYASLEAATGILIPTEAGGLAFSGTANLINLAVKYDLKLYGIFVNLYDSKMAAQRAYYEQYEVNFVEQFIPMVVSKSALFTNAVLQNKTGYEIQGKKTHKDLEAYIKIAELLVKDGHNG